MHEPKLRLFCDCPFLIFLLLFFFPLTWRFYSRYLLRFYLSILPFAKLGVNYGQSLEIGPWSIISVMDHFTTIFHEHFRMHFTMPSISKVDCFADRSILALLWTTFLTRISGDIYLDDVTSVYDSFKRQRVKLRKKKVEKGKTNTSSSFFYDLKNSGNFNLSSSHQFSRFSFSIPFSSYRNIKTDFYYIYFILTAYFKTKTSEERTEMCANVYSDVPPQNRHSYFCIWFCSYTIHKLKNFPIYLSPLCKVQLCRTCLQAILKSELRPKESEWCLHSMGLRSPIVSKE